MSLLNPNVVKVLMVISNKTPYISAGLQSLTYGTFLQKNGFYKAFIYKHIGLYAYRTDVLKEIVKLPAGSLETVESLEHLRWLENGFRISVVITEHESIAIDTPEDLLKLTNKIG
jgi:3-deoxy-manno-octulosonate cytidylyltransferase (CMP-KDO synthetase)